MKNIVVLFNLFLLTGCMTTKVVGGYDVYGVVIDGDTNEPIEGVQVSLRYEAVSVAGSNSKVVGNALTDKDGRFYIRNPKRRMWGGTGQLSGYIREWPGIYYRKTGYCKTVALFTDANIEKYQNVRLKLSRKDYCL